jgi:hypothetical protein
LLQINCLSIIALVRVCALVHSLVVLLTDITAVDGAEVGGWVRGRFRTEVALGAAASALGVAETRSSTIITRWAWNLHGTGASRRAVVARGAKPVAFLSAQAHGRPVAAGRALVLDGAH